MFKKDSAIHYTIFILCIGVLTLLVVLLLRSDRTTTLSDQNQEKSNEITSSSPATSDNLKFNQTLVAGDVDIPVAIANTDATRQQGLSDTASLPADSGMLFEFDTPGNYGFWMKDMDYPLDFVWLDSGMKIIGITPNVAVATYPQIFYPPSPAQYELEVNANFSTTHGLKVGQQMHLQ
jgi:uncharacterized membrane protein (UPF0127 family)